MTGADWTAPQPEPAADPRGPRLWPVAPVLGLQLVALALSVTPTIPNVVRFGFMVLGPLACVGLFGLWLLFASRLPRGERFLYPALALGLGGVTAVAADRTVGVALWIYGAPLSMLAVAVAVAVGRSWATRSRAALAAGLLVAVWVPFALVRLDGFTGTYFPEFAARWAPPAEPPLGVPVDPAERDRWAVTAVEWPQFRGPNQDGRATGFVAPLDWTAAGPVERWRIDMGAGWSSFASVSGRLFTQEQRGEQELVTCYDAGTGALVWQFAHPNRFSDAVAGAGPRATPTYADGRVFALGARGVLTALDARTGERLWQRDLMKEVNAALPVWGFSGSPLVAGGAVVVYAGGDGENGLMAFRAGTGETVWAVPSRGMNFGTAQRATLGGRELVLFADDKGLMALDPGSGATAWRYKPRDWRGVPICQPQQVGPGSLLVPLGDGVGLARLEVAFDGAGWQVTEAWATRKLRPSFNDFVVLDGHVYGFDQSAFCCLDAATGRVKWRDGDYGFGQVLALQPVGRLIVTTEAGEAVLLAADPGEHRELGRVRLWEGKTWNHPVVAGGRLFVRNGRFAACYELPAPR